MTCHRFLRWADLSVQQRRAERRARRHVAPASLNPNYKVGRCHANESRGARASGVWFSASRRKLRPTIFLARGSSGRVGDESSGATPELARRRRALPISTSHFGLKAPPISFRMRRVFDGDKSPAESGDESPHSKGFAVGLSLQVSSRRFSQARKQSERGSVSRSNSASNEALKNCGGCRPCGAAAGHRPALCFVCAIAASRQPRRCFIRSSQKPR